jgi:hypothetical protein
MTMDLERNEIQAAPKESSPPRNQPPTFGAGKQGMSKVSLAPGNNHPSRRPNNQAPTRNGNPLSRTGPSLGVVKPKSGSRIGL